MKRKNIKVNGKSVNALDATQAAITQFGKGVKRGNPSKCFYCLKPIRQNHEWVKDTSESDPKLGAYTLIMHSRCIRLSGHK